MDLLRDRDTRSGLRRLCVRPTCTSTIMQGPSLSHGAKAMARSGGGTRQFGSSISCTILGRRSRCTRMLRRTRTPYSWLMKTSFSESRCSSFLGMQVLDFVMMFGMLGEGDGSGWRHVSRNHAARDLDVSSRITKSMAVLRL